MNYRNLSNIKPIPLTPTSLLPLSGALWNARSICNKLHVIHDLFLSRNLAFLGLTETWLTPSDTASPAALWYRGLHFTHTPRPGNKHGGGVGLLLSPNCTFNPIPPLPSLILPSFEVHSVRIYSPTNLQVAIIYRPPGPATAFIDQFSTWLLHFLSADIPTIIMGDFNIPIDTLQLTASKLLSLTSSFGLTQWSSAATHIDGHTLDLVFTRLCSLSNFTTSPLPLSDHHLLTFSSLSSPPVIHVQQNAHPRRNLAHLDTHTLSASIRRLATISSLHDTDSATLASAIDTVAPLVHGRVRRINRQPWHNNTTKKLRQVSRVAELRWKKTHLQDDFIAFKQTTLAFNPRTHIGGLLGPHAYIFAIICKITLVRILKLQVFLKYVVVDNIQLFI
ncbi:uncharacterized protein [Ranitomeya imitator]|uniref:uncharacterized protein n=1 Tax=Ranitomeya imitator TaxID=111125 RepID=UPI0037E8B662